MSGAKPDMPFFIIVKPAKSVAVAKTHLNGVLNILNYNALRLLNLLHLRIGLTDSSWLVTEEINCTIVNIPIIVNASKAQSFL